MSKRLSIEDHIKKLREELNSAPKEDKPGIIENIRRWVERKERSKEDDEDGFSMPNQITGPL